MGIARHSNRWAASSKQAEPDFAPAEIAFRVLRAWNSANTYGARLREHPDAFKDTLKAEIEEGLRLTAHGSRGRPRRRTGRLWRRFQAFLENYEYFVLPTTQLPPFDINTPYPTEIAGVKLDNYIDWMKSCWYISATGNPAASVPAASRLDGLPVGVQIVGRDQRTSACCKWRTRSKKRPDSARSAGSAGSALTTLPGRTMPHRAAPGRTRPH